MIPRKDSDPITIHVDDDCVVVTGVELQQDRESRLFFNSIVGGIPTDSGWRCPKRNLPLSTLVVRINAYLESRKYEVHRIGLADDEVSKEIEKKRSFERALKVAQKLRQGETDLDLKSVKAHLEAMGWDDSQRRLYSHQEAGVIHALSAVNAANFSVPGAGKTITTLAVAASHIANGTIDVVIVVGPLSCFGPWEKETRAALSTTLNPIRVRGTSTQRRAIYRRVRPRQLLLLSYATAATDKTELISICRSLKTMLIVDESHRVKRFRGGFWAPALVDLAKVARVKIILSGTPMPQGGRDLYSQLRILWPSGELTGPPDDFATRVDKNFNAVLADVRPFVSRTPKEALGLSPYVVRRHAVDLAPVQGQIYELIESQFRRHIEDAETWREKIERLKRARPIRLLQAAANPDLLNRNDGYYRLPRLEMQNPTLLDRLATYHNGETPAKSLRALDITKDIVRRVASTGGKIVCWSNFIQNLDQYSELVRSRLGLPVFQIDGRVPAGDQPWEESANLNPLDMDTRESIIEKFLHLPGPSVLVANPASTSESISLHETCHNAIYLDRTYDCALFLQSIDRIHRLGLRRGQSVEVHIILATRDGRDTIDQLVDLSLALKEQNMRQLLEGAELAPLQSLEDPLESAEGTVRDLGDLLRYLLGEELADEGAL